jgi:DNA modification methylase
MLGRHFIGYEAEKKFIDIARKDIDKPLPLRKPTICRYGSPKGYVK